MFLFKKWDTFISYWKITFSSQLFLSSTVIVPYRNTMMMMLYLIFILFVVFERSLPDGLLQMMEENRNVTVHWLTEQGASIVDPAHCLDQNQSNKNGETSDGKTSLLAYLLSWQLILQIFQTSSLDRRAKLANFLHSGQHVSDLATCLFCVVPTSMVNNNQVDAKGRGFILLILLI